MRKAVSFPVLLGVLLVAGTFAATSGGRFFAAGDTWWHLVAGRNILTTHTWPTSDSYSFTVSGNDWIAYEWLGDVAMALAEHLGGWRGLTSLLVVLASTLMLLLYYLAYLRSGNAKAAAAACAMLLPVATVFFTVRPQLLGYNFLVITLICLEKFRQGRQKALWVLPGVFLLWVNAHGTFALGLIILGLYWASGLAGFRIGCIAGERWTARQRRQMAIVFLICTLVLPLTPYGSLQAAYPLNVGLLIPVSFANITEWYPLPLFHGTWAHGFLGLLLLFVLLQALFGSLVYRVEEMVLLLFAVYESLLHVRFLLFFTLVFAPLLAALLARWVPGYMPEKDKYVLNAVLIAVILVGLARLFPSSAVVDEALDRQYPKRAVEFLRQHPSIGPTFNENAWGGYLLWSGRKVFIDGRSEIYEYAGVLEDYIRIVNLDPAAQLLLRKYGVEACLLEKGTSLGTFLAALPDWKRVYEDNLSVIYVR
ncbi:MAG: hypothetical protein DMG24_13610, partial [Acidobacteria bacterium]